MAPVQTDHTRPIQFHVGGLLWGKGAKGDNKVKGEREGGGQEGLPFIWAVRQLCTSLAKVKSRQMDQVDAENVWQLPWQQMCGSLLPMDDITIIAEFRGNL